MKFHFFHLMPWPDLPADFDDKSKHPSAWATLSKYYDPERDICSTTASRPISDQCRKPRSSVSRQKSFCCGFAMGLERNTLTAVWLSNCGSLVAHQSSSAVMI